MIMKMRTQVRLLDHCCSFHFFGYKLYRLTLFCPYLPIDVNTRLCVSVRDYYCYKVQMRRGIFNPILYGKRLFQQYVVGMYMKVEGARLDYI